MLTVRTLAKGQVVIPAPLRKQLAIEPGDLLEVSLSGDHIELRPVPKDPIAAFSGSLSGGKNLANGLIEEHASEVGRDSGR